MPACSPSRLPTASPTRLQSRFLVLLGGAFKGMAPALALSVLDPRLTYSEAETAASVQAGVMVARGDNRPLSPYDLKRLQVGGQAGGSV